MRSVLDGEVMKMTKKKTTVNLSQRYVNMLAELENEFGLNQTSAIQFGIMQAHKFYFPKGGKSFDLMHVFKGGIYCSKNPMFPRADYNDVYTIMEDGLIGGDSGFPVEMGDKIRCIKDGTLEGDFKSVCDDWEIRHDGSLVYGTFK